MRIDQQRKPKTMIKAPLQVWSPTSFAMMKNKDALGYRRKVVMMTTKKHNKTKRRRREKEGSKSQGGEFRN